MRSITFVEWMTCYSPRYLDWLIKQVELAEELDFITRVRPSLDDLYPNETDYDETDSVP